MLFFYCWNLTFLSYRSLRSFWTFHSVSALFLSWVTSSSFSFWLMTLVRPEALRTEGRLKKTSFSMPYMPCHKQKRSDTGLSPQICGWFMLQGTSSEQSSKTIILQPAQKFQPRCIQEDKQYRDVFDQMPGNTKQLMAETPPSNLSLTLSSLRQGAENVQTQD